MSQEQQLKQGFQQFCFGNTKLVFFFDSQQLKIDKDSGIVKQRTKKSCSQHNKNKAIKVRKQKLSLPLKQNNGLNNNSRTSKNLYTSQTKSRNNKNIEGFLQSPSNRSRVTNKSESCNKENSKRKQIKFCLDPYQQKSVENRQQKCKQLVIQNKQQKLNHQWHYIMGSHHLLYRQNIDYLTYQKSRQSQWINMSEEGYEYDFYKRNLDIQKGEFMIRNSYNFENDRASITQYLSTKNSGSKESYNKITKENLRNRSYIDKDFTYSDCFKIISSQVKWTYISPEPSLLIFPKVKKLNNVNHIQNNKLPILNFINFLYNIKPNIFFRLMQPPINNVFSVWLFFDGKFQPVLIDGQFPISKKNDKFYFSGNNQQIWQQIFVKAICKLKRILKIQNLKMITNQQIYQLLTGNYISSPKSQHLLSSKQVLLGYWRKQKLKNRTLFFTFNNQYKLLDQSMCSELVGQKNVNLYYIQTFENFYVTEIDVFFESITKFQIAVEKNCEFFVGIPNFKQSSHAKLYVYKLEQQNGTSQDSKLRLHCQINPFKQRKVKLKNGYYKLFFQDTQNLIKQIFKTQIKGISLSQLNGKVVSPLKNSLKKQNQPKDRNYTISFISSSQIKIRNEQKLRRKLNVIEDSQNIYRA